MYSVPLKGQGSVKSRLLPTADTHNDFYLGGLYALVLFALIVMLFFRVLQGLSEIHTYALQQSTSVTVSLTSVPLPTSKKTDAPRPVPKEEQKPEPAPAAETAPAEDISSLFSDVHTQKIVHKERPKEADKVDAKRVAALQKRIKTSEKRTTSATAEAVKNLALVKPSQEQGGSKTSGGAEVNAYYARIQAIIYDNFFPPANTEGAVSLIRIWLSASGKMTRFEVLRRSGDTLFDEEVRALESRLKQVAFERNPKGNEAVLDVSLVSKE